MLKPLVAGLEYHQSMIVEERHTVPHVCPDWPGFSDMPPVFATAFMVGFMEQTCIEALRPFLEEGQHTVGTHVDMSHIAATSIGGNITAHITLIEVDGRKLRFEVSCEDSNGLIGKGFHNRAIIDMDRFLARLSKA